MRTNGVFDPLDRRVATRGLAILGGVTAWFTVWKLLMWASYVTHAQANSIQRVMFGHLVKFPQEPITLVDTLTAFFLMMGGTAVLMLTIWMGDRIRHGDRDAAAMRWQRPFWTMVGAGLIWLGCDEQFTIHEFIGANLGFDDNWVLVGYALAAIVVCWHWRAVFLQSKAGLALLAIGAFFHGSSLILDKYQDSFAWTPEEPFEMLGAGFYAIAMSVYALRTVAYGTHAVPAPAAEPQVASAPPAV